MELRGPGAKPLRQRRAVHRKIEFRAAAWFDRNNPMLGIVALSPLGSSIPRTIGRRIALERREAGLFLGEAGKDPPTSMERCHARRTAKRPAPEHHRSAAAPARLCGALDP